MNGVSALSRCLQSVPACTTTLYCYYINVKAVSLYYNPLCFTRLKQNINSLATVHPCSALKTYVKLTNVLSPDKSTTTVQKVEYFRKQAAQPCAKCQTQAFKQNIKISWRISLVLQKCGCSKLKGRKTSTEF